MHLASRVPGSPVERKMIAMTVMPPAHTTTGRGPAVLFIQGVGMPGSAWRPQTDPLAEVHTCTSFDHRGIGASPKSATPPSVTSMALDSLAVLDALGTERAHLVGHSLGGLVALQVALLARARVRSLSLLCTFARGRSAGASLRMAWIGARTRIGTARMRRHAFLEIVYPKAHLATHDRDALAAELAPLFGRDLASTPSISGAHLAAMRACDLEPRLPELAGIPTLVVSGAHDPIAPPALGLRIANGIRGARFVAFAEAAHGVPIHFAVQINALLREHFASAERASD